MRALLPVAAAAAALLSAPPARAGDGDLELAVGLDHRSLGSSEPALERLDTVAASFSAPRALARTAGGRLEGRGGEVVALDLRTTGELASHVYTGLDLSLGGARLRDPSLARAGVILDGRGGVYYGLGSVTGLVLSLGPLRARGELCAGVRGLFVRFRVDRAGTGRHLFTQAIVPVLEPRAALELELGDRLALGARAGSDLLRRGDLVTGVYATLRWPPERR